LDGCLLDSSELKKADFVFLICEEKKVYFVELKGSNLRQAARQINSSLDELSEQLKGYQPVFGRIVLSKTPNPKLIGSELVRLKKRLEKLGGNLKYNTRIIEENL